MSPTDSEGDTEPTGSLLRLYPGGYRTAHGQEILDVHRELTMDLAWPARLRADADLIAHALRVRLGLDSASSGGRFFALANPFALAVTAAYGGIQLMRWYAGIALSPGSTWSHLATTDLRQGLQLLLLAMMCAGAITGLIRRSPPFAAIGLLGFAAEWTIARGLYAEGLPEAIAAALTAFVLLACPPDRRGDRQYAVLAGGMAAVAWFPIALVETRNFVFSTDYGAWPLLTLALAGVISIRTAGPRALAASAAASPLFIAYATALISL